MAPSEAARIYTTYGIPLEAQRLIVERVLANITPDDVLPEGRFKISLGQGREMWLEVG